MARKGLVAAAVAVATLVSGGAALAATGELNPRGCIGDNDTGLDTCGQSTDGLGIVYSVAVSADGRSVYAAGGGDDAIVTFRRNRTTGALTPAGCIDDNDSGADTCDPSTDGLDGASSVAVSADGRSVYVASDPDDAIVRFRRNRTTGALKPGGCVDDNDTGPDTCARSTDGLNGANSVAVSADGRSVYAASFLDDAIVRFRREN
jgi:fibronectin-binding autotransporter adhesin